MCDERERLIEYIYGESDSVQRREVEAHLVDCHVCRREVAGLQGVRDDLLAWEVPRHEAVWRPMAPTPPVALWQRVPAWGLVAAATAVFATGLAGGIAARGWSSPSGGTPVAVVVAQPEGGQAHTVALTAEDLQRLEARIEASVLARVRGEVDTRLASVAATPAPGLVQASTGTSSSREAERIADRLATIERWMDDQITLNNVFNGNFGRLNTRTSDLRDMVETGMQRVGFTDPGGR